MKTRLAVFASGNGTNFDEIYKNTLNGFLDAEIALVVVDNYNAKIIEKVKQTKIECFVFNPKDYTSKQDYEKEISLRLKACKIDLIILAGYMRLIGDTLLNAYPNKIINVHPSLLPAFKGKDAIGQAFAYGVKVIGVSIHFVDKSLDGGKIIAQQAFNIGSHDLETVTSEIHEVEYKLYSNTIKQLLEGGIK